MMDHAPVLMIVLPVFASLALTLIGPLGHRAAYGNTVLSIAGSWRRQWPPWCRWFRLAGRFSTVWGTGCRPWVSSW